MTHPLSSGLILLTQTIIIRLITGNFFINFWFRYILFLIIIGGMLILFIYITRIASNEKFSIRFSNFIPLITILFLFTITILYFYFIINFTNNEIIIFNKSIILNISINKYFSYPLNSILLFIIIYLFITLIAIVKITNFNKGPLRQIN